MVASLLGLEFLTFIILQSEINVAIIMLSCNDKYMNFGVFMEIHGFLCIVQPSKPFTAMSRSKTRSSIPYQEAQDESRN
jgi:hypothetical protein